MAWRVELHPVASVFAPSIACAKWNADDQNTVVIKFILEGGQGRLAVRDMLESMVDCHQIEASVDILNIALYQPDGSRCRVRRQEGVDPGQIGKALVREFFELFSRPAANIENSGGLLQGSTDLSVD